MLSHSVIHILFVIVILPGVSASRQHEHSFDCTQARTCFTRDTIPPVENKEVEFPGGTPAWQHYLMKNLHYPEQAQNNEVQGDVQVKFLVDTLGNTSEIHAISGPKLLRAESERVIRESGKWTPATSNGKPVEAYKIQVLKYRIEVSK